MCRRFVLPDAVLQGERLGQGCGQLGIDPVVELEQIRLPGAVRADAVCPAVVGVGTEIFAVIGKVLLQSVPFHLCQFQDLENLQRTYIVQELHLSSYL